MSLRITESGRGPAVLLIHGAPTPSSHFAALAAELERDHRVLVVDLPGYAGVPPLPGPYSFPTVRRQIEDALLERQAADCAMVGLSVGAYRAFALALGLRVRVGKLVSLGGFAGVPAGAKPMLRELSSAVRRGDQRGDAFVTRMLAPAFAAAHRDAAAAVGRWPEVTTEDVLASEMEALTEGEDFVPRLRELGATSVLVRVGELDAAAPPLFSEAISTHAPSAKLELVEGAGHALLLEDERATINSVARFLRA